MRLENPYSVFRGERNDLGFLPLDFGRLVEGEGVFWAQLPSMGAPCRIGLSSTHEPSSYCTYFLDRRISALGSWGLVTPFCSESIVAIPIVSDPLFGLSVAIRPTVIVSLIFTPLIVVSSIDVFVRPIAMPEWVRRASLIPMLGSKFG